ncbi:MAG: pyruvate kinase alpha/beta domain-containing protein [Candidatus Hodarchaeota archaeon]
MDTCYFPSAGPHNTAASLERALKYAQEANIKTIVLASTTGATAQKMIEYRANHPNLQLIIVTHHTGFGIKGTQEFDKNIEAEIRNQPNCQILTTSHALSGVERSFRKEFKTMLPIEMVALTLRRTFGDGTKVCMEIAIMAADSGLVDTENDVLCIGGTGRGADTVWQVRPSTSNRLFDLRMKKLIAKPSEF